MDQNWAYRVQSRTKRERERERERESSPPGDIRIHQAVSAIVGTDQHSQCAERTGATSSVVGRSAYEPLPIALLVSVYIVYITFIVLYTNNFKCYSIT